MRTDDGTSAGGSGEDGPITISVEIVGVLKRPKMGARFPFEVERDITVEGLLRELGYSDEHIRFLLVIINGRTVHHEESLHDGDNVVVMLPVGGG